MLESKQAAGFVYHHYEHHRVSVCMQLFCHMEIERRRKSNEVRRRVWRQSVAGLVAVFSCYGEMEHLLYHFFGVYGAHSSRILSTYRACKPEE